MKTIYKFEIPAEDEFSLKMSAGARVLSAQTHGEGALATAQCWVLVDTDRPLVDHLFAVRGTGHNAEGLESATYIGAFQFGNGALVFHLFDRGEFLVRPEQSV